MMRSVRIAAAACALLVAGCATTTTPSPAVVGQRASIAIDELVRLNAAAQTAVAFFLPWLSPERAARVRLAASLADAAIARVAAARDLASQEAAVADARTAIAGYKWLAGA